MLIHFKKSGHPEDPDRIKRIMAILADHGLTDSMRLLPCRMVRKEEAMLVHSEDHWEKVCAIQCELVGFHSPVILASVSHPISRRCVVNILMRYFSDMNEQAFIDSEEYYEQMSLYVNEGTTTAAMLSCGGVIEASLAVARGEVKKSFAIVRPPGHHAEPDEHMGFCFFNNVAVAARVVQQTTNIKKILILDWYVYPSFFMVLMEGLLISFG